MNIAICFKVIADIAQLSQSDWSNALDAWSAQSDENAAFPKPLSALAQKGGTEIIDPFDFGWLRKIISPYDETALELGLRLADTLAASSGDDEIHCHLQAVTLGHSIPQSLLKHVMALGMEPVQLIPAKPLKQGYSDPEAIARLLAQYLSSKPQDIIMLGQKSAAGGSGETGFLIAEQLGLPCIDNVTAIDMKDGELTVTNQNDHIQRRFIVKTPTVLLVGNVAGAQYLRIPTLMNKLSVKGRAIESHTLSESLQHQKSTGCVETVAIEEKARQRHSDWIDGTNQPIEQTIQSVLRAYRDQPEAL